MSQPNSRQDRVRTAAEAGAVLGGAAAGAAAAPALASLAGMTAIPVVTKAAALVGATVVAATPVGWVVGCAAAVGAAAYGVAKMIGNGGEVDGERRAHTIVREEAGEIRQQAGRRATLTGPVMRRFGAELATAVRAQLISPGQARRLGQLVRLGALDVREATVLISKSARRTSAAPAARSVRRPTRHST